MTERERLLKSVADAIADYRAGDLTAPTPGHVDKWVRQFDGPVHLPLLRELLHVLERSYFTRQAVIAFLSRLINNQKLAGGDPCAFWARSHFLNIQQRGHSQEELLELFDAALQEKCGVGIDDCGADGGDFIYLDDVIFSGGRIGNDLREWITKHAPSTATLHIVTIAAHCLGEWQCTKGLKETAKGVGKKIEIHSWSSARFENRKSKRDNSEVLWPSSIPADPALEAYINAEKKFPFQPRNPGGRTEHDIFSSEDGRQLLERELLLAGMRIRAFSKNPSQILRPLGFSPFGLGFGGLIITFRNCPNNCPLALWWGDPKAGASHPFSKWYPLLPRKTYDGDDDF